MPPTVLFRHICGTQNQAQLEQHKVVHGNEPWEVDRWRYRGEQRLARLEAAVATRS
jgi:hypothetical protein